MAFPAEGDAKGARIHAQFLLTRGGNIPATEQPSAGASSARRSIQSITVAYASDLTGNPGLIDRQAGALVLDAYPHEVVSASAGLSGDAIFEPKLAYLEQLGASDFTPSAQQQLALAIWNVSLEDVRILKAAFPKVDLQMIIAVRLLGCSAQTAAELKAELPTMDVRDLVAFIMRGITPGDVRDLKESGGARLTPADILGRRT
ncbi:MAG: hypothetical protein ACYDA5_01350 [Vulcanimicrobiaceae bacterium]